MPRLEIFSVIIVSFKKNNENKNAALLPNKSGAIPKCAPVTSRAKTVEVKIALVAPENMEDIQTRAVTCAVIPISGKK